VTPADLTAWRKRLCINRLEAAAALGIGRNTYARYEERGPVPRYIWLASLALEAIVLHIEEEGWP
jgi:transcriptional regulator with XRE-family HTH domain